jgi:ADP-heptose:LPS heptosyltransferase
VFVLSRITLGADVAITSIVLQLVQRAFPTAERYLVGPSGSGQLLTGLSGSRFVERSYEKGGLLRRLDAWHATSQLLQDMTAGLDDADWLVVDPDSRLTQLGLLPIATSTVPYLFFESRSYAIPGLETLGELTAHWLQRALLLDSEEGTRPRLELAMSEIERARQIVHAFRRAGAFVVAVNLGVGGNARKRIPGEFEVDLIRRLITDGSRVILDYGIGEEETRVTTIVAALRNEGRRVCELGATASDASSIPNDCDVVTYRGPVAPFAALIGASNLYVGYDSAFQHIAAAQGVAVIDIFVNSPNATFLRRWRPHSSAPVTVVETTAHADDVTLDQISDAHRRLRQAATL